MRLDALDKPLLNLNCFNFLKQLLKLSFFFLSSGKGSSWMFLKPSRTPSVSGKWWLATSGKPGIRSLSLKVFVLSGLGNLEGVSTSPLHSRYIQTLEHVYI